MFNRLLDRIGDWNPQLFRELKGSLKPRTVGMTVAIALIIQFLFMGLAYSMLPYDGNFSSYCIEMDQGYTCARDAAGQVLIDWDQWWTDLFRIVNWAMLLLVPLAGTFLLTNDICQEAQRGTLDTVRLSPQSSRQFFVGKLLGVPAVLYLSVGLFVPLHGVLAAGAKAIAFWLGFYALLIGGCLFLFSAAMLLGLVSKRADQRTDYASSSAIALGGMFFAGFIFLPAFISWNFNTCWYRDNHILLFTEGSGLRWYGIPLNGNPIMSYGLTLTICGVGTVWLWKALQRRFHRPQISLLSKRQSYGVALSLQGLVLGLFMNDLPGLNGDFARERVIGFSIAALAIFLGVIFGIANSRQTLLDWARYRHTQPRRSLLWDLLFGDGSPMLGAILLNLLVTAVLTLAWVLNLPGLAGRASLVLNLVLSFGAIALYAVITQLILLSKSRRRAATALAALIVVMFIPLLLSAIAFGSEHTTAGYFWMMFSPIPAVMAQQGASLSTLIWGILAQWSAFVVLSARLTLQLRQAGATSSQALFQPSTTAR